MTRNTKLPSLKPAGNRVSSFVVILAGRIIHAADTRTQATTSRDAHGAGVVYQRVIVMPAAVSKLQPSDRKGVRP